MKAIIMAGGEGMRLRPLTCDCPKPMLEIMGKPIMEYALRLIQKCGVRETAVTLGYLPRPVMDYFGSGESFDMDIRYYIEKSPLGTAGSVGMAKDFLNARFIVLSGDGICDFDLSEAVKFHIQRDAQATMILKKCPNPQEYGMVVLNSDSTVRSFHEKPGRHDVCSDLINTGIYILEPELLERIPQGVPCDFGHDFFPGLLADGIAVHGFTAAGYWCDVGDVGAYLRVHQDAMDGRIGVIPSNECAVSPDAVIEPGARIEMPCCISAGAHICSGAHIGAYTQIDHGAVIRSGASVKKSIVMKNAQVFENAQLRGCVLARNAVVERGAQLFEESVAGTDARIGSDATLMPGVKLWPCKVLADGQKGDENIVWGAKREQRFIGGRLQLDDPAHTARCVQACVSAMKADEIVIGRGLSAVADAIQRAAIAGAMAQGVQIYDAGVCSLPQLRHIQRSLHAACAALVDECGLMPLDAGGTALSEQTQRGILRAIERQDYSGAFTGLTRPVRDASGDLAYIADTAALFCANPAYAPRLLLACENPHVLHLAEQVCLRAGLRVRTEWNAEAIRPDADEIAVTLSPDGEQSVLGCASGQMDEVQRQLMCAWTLLQLGETQLMLRLDATRAIDVLCEAESANVIYVPGGVNAWSNAVRKKSATQFRIQFDGTAAALAFISALTDRGLSFAQWQKLMPQAHRSFRRVHMDAAQSGAALKRLFEESSDAQLGGGIRLNCESGWAWLTPDEARPEMCIMAESTKYETADELCCFYANALERLSGGTDD